MEPEPKKLKLEEDESMGVQDGSNQIERLVKNSKFILITFVFLSIIIILFLINTYLRAMIFRHNRCV